MRCGTIHSRIGSIRRGKSGGLSNDQIDNLLVDFDEKSTDEGSDSEEDESATAPIAGEVSSPRSCLSPR